MATRRFVKLYLDVMDRPKLSGNAKVVYSAISNRQSGAGLAWPGIRQIGTDIGASQGAVLRAIQSLEAAGLLEISRVRGRPNRYRCLPPDQYRNDTTTATETGAVDQYRNGSSGATETGADCSRNDSRTATETVANLDYRPKKDSKKENSLPLPPESTWPDATVQAVIDAWPPRRRPPVLAGPGQVRLAMDTWAATPKPPADPAAALLASVQLYLKGERDHEFVPNLTRWLAERQYVNFVAGAATPAETPDPEWDALVARQTEDLRLEAERVARRAAEASG